MTHFALPELVTVTAAISCPCIAPPGSARTVSCANVQVVCGTADAPVLGPLAVSLAELGEADGLALDTVASVVGLMVSGADDTDVDIGAELDGDVAVPVPPVVHALSTAQPAITAAAATSRAEPLTYRSADRSNTAGCLP